MSQAGLWLLTTNIQSTFPGGNLSGGLFFFKILVLCAHIEYFSTVKGAGEFLSFQGDSLFTSGGGGGLAQVTGFSLGSVLAEQPEFGGLSRIAQCGIPTQGLHLRYFNIFYRSYCLRGSLGDPERNFSSLINHDGWGFRRPASDTRPRHTAG